MTDRAVSVLDPDLESDRRAQILDCACRVIARDGSAGLRMSAVAREAGVSSALLHYYFATREDLIRLAFEHHERRETIRTEERLRQIGDPLARVRHVLSQELSDDPNVQEGWILWNELEHAALFRDDFRATAAEHTRHWVELVAVQVAAAQDAGRIDPEIDAASAALRLTCVVDSLGVHVLLGTLDRERAQLELDAALRDILHLGLPRRA